MFTMPYRRLHGQNHRPVPVMTEDGVESYLQLDGHTLQDKCKDMYRGQYLKSVRMAVQDSDAFIQGRVSAKMIKKCVYTVDIRLDGHHVVVVSM